ncbi:hypothetical protein V8D89_008194 [Ganoderma adspersum]
MIASEVRRRRIIPIGSTEAATTTIFPSTTFASTTSSPKPSISTSVPTPTSISASDSTSDTTSTPAPNSNPQSWKETSEPESQQRTPTTTTSGVANSKTSSESSDLNSGSSTITATGTTSPTATSNFAWQTFPLTLKTTSLTATPNFAWSTFSATVKICTAATFKWDYTGPQETIQLLLVPATSPPASAAIQKRVKSNITLATGLDTTALRWTWPQVDASVGQYVVVALGDGIDTPALPLLVITNGTDTSCLAATPATTTPAISGRREPNGAVLAAGITGGAVALVIAIGGYLVWRRSRTRQEPYGFASFVAARLPRPAEDGRHELLLDVATHPPSTSHRQPPSSLMSEPRTPALPYMLRRQTLDQEGESFDDVSIIGSGLSTPSDMTSMSALMPTSPSTYLPSYATSLSSPPSYTTEVAHVGSPSPPAKRSYASSS